MKFVFAAFALVAVGGTAAQAETPFSNVAAISDSELSDLRGGFTLPNGLDIGLAIRQETAVDGQAVLRTYYVLQNTGPVITIEPVGSGLVLKQTENNGRYKVSVNLPGTQVSHLMGRTNGSIIANTADNRTISTVTTIDLDLSQVPTGAIGNVFPSVGNIARESALFSIG